MKSSKNVYAFMGCIGLLFQIVISEAQDSNVGPRIPRKNGQSIEAPPTPRPTPSIAADYGSHRGEIHTSNPIGQPSRGHPVVLWGRAITSGDADYGFVAQRALQPDGTINLEFWILLGKKGSANSDGTIPTEGLAGSHKFGANEETQFMDSLPGAANWKQKTDGFVRGLHTGGTSTARLGPSDCAYWIQQATSYVRRRDFAHALQCLQQARALAVGPQKTVVDRLTAMYERAMAR